MKSYTDLEQSKKLAEILPTESADMRYDEYISHIDGTPKVGYKKGVTDGIPCWSLVALLGVLPFPQLSKDKLGNNKEGWIVSVYPDNCRYDSSWHDNPVDACCEMILKLNELKML